MKGRVILETTDRAVAEAVVAMAIGENRTFVFTVRPAGERSPQIFIVETDGMIIDSIVGDLAERVFIRAIGIN